MGKRAVVNPVWGVLFVLLVSVGAVARAASPDIIARGRYLARVGNCAGCHTAPGGRDFAGGLALSSPFGMFHTPNITPDADTGIGAWTEADFWQALHFGKRPDGSPMYPACPYPNYTRVRRGDMDAIFAYLRSVPPVRKTNSPPDLSFPASVRSFVSVWQALFFDPGVYAPQSDRGIHWNRGAYLVNGLAHCAACHAARNALGATREGADVPGQTVHGWYAPSLHSPHEAGLQAWKPSEAARFLRTGRAGAARANGPMADVVYQSLQYLAASDAEAMAVYLTGLPESELEPPHHPVPVGKPEAERLTRLGRSIYQDNCQECHGATGEGSMAAPALAGNRAVTLEDPTNMLRMIREGGYPPSTGGNPRPFGMPPFYGLTDREVAAVATFIRGSWGNHGSPVSTADSNR